MSARLWTGTIRPRVKRLARGPLAPLIRRALKTLLLEYHVVYGRSDRLSLAPTARVNNALFNTVSGRITVEDHAFFGFHVSLLTGTHDYRRLDPSRQDAVLEPINDIVVGEGVWLASNVTVIGPCKIGAWAVVAAGSLVREDVPPYCVVAGVPARIVKRLSAEHGDTSPALGTADRDRDSGVSN